MILHHKKRFLIPKQQMLNIPKNIGGYKKNNYFCAGTFR